ncbi:hypothetical protein [Nocardia cyriacigeorgica]|uniref:hypothetical protein n=1 Tax=Nocardia cyriacigeorgica TaxID=135487 RepID=UPI002457BA39|nr:hypothetical protein [Nocardia cyriacigeorgica]
MSDRSPEDEIAAEARKFWATLSQLSQRHAQARNWLERRQVRKEISRTLREERRQADHMRKHHLTWTSQMVDRYQAHALAIEARRHDPTVDHDRRARDAKALAEHANDLRARIVTNTRLTEVERGIALDGLDAATAFPHYKVGKLFDKAHRVKGLDALRYRAAVARTQNELGIARQAPREQLGLDRAQVQAQLVNREQQVQPPARPTGQLTAAQAEAIQGLRTAQLAWNIEAPNASAIKRDHLTNQWRHAAREAERAGLTEQRIDWEFRNAERNSVYTAQVHATRGPGHEVHTMHGFHPSEAEAVQWVHQQTAETPWAPGVALKATIHQRGNKAPIRLADGNVEHVTAGAAAWKAEIDRNKHSRATVQTDAPPDGAADQRLAEMDRRLQLMQRGLDAVTADRDETRSLLAQAEGRIEELKNRNIRLAAEIGEVRRTAGERVETLTAERDKYRTERDEAVQKIAQSTPREQRYGSAERVATSMSEDTQAMPKPNRNGYERTR